MKDTFLLPHFQKLGNLKNWPNAEVPTSAQVNDYIPWLCKTPCDYLLRDDPEGMAECTLLVQEYLGIDSLNGNLDMYNFEAESMGASINFYKDHMPDLNRSNYLIQNKKDLDRIKWNGLNSGRFPYLLHYMNTYRKYTGLPVSFSFSGPWTLAGNLYGLDNLVIDTIEDPDFVTDLLHKIVCDFHAPMFRDLMKLYPNMNRLNFADAFASPPMVNLSIIKEFIKPALALEKNVLDNEQLSVVTAGIWGITQVPPEDKEEFIDLTAEFGGNTIFAFDPDLSTIGPKYFRQYADKTLKPLTFGLSTAFLQTATPDQVAEQVKYYILEGKKGITPFIFFYNNIAPGTPIQNISAAQAAVKTYGDPKANADTPLMIPKKESFETFLRHKLSENKEGYTFNWLAHSEYTL